MLEINIINKREIEKAGLEGIEVFAQAWLDGKQLGFGKDGTVDIERFLIFKTFNGSEEAQMEALRQVISQVGKPGDNIVPGKTGNTTYTLYPQTGVVTAPIDGVVSQSGTNVTFATLRAGAGNGHLDDAYGEMDAALLGADTTTDRFDRLVRGIFGFNTSVIGSETIVSAVFSLVPTTLQQTGIGDTDVDIVTASPASEANFVNSDFAIANFGSTRLATGKSISTLVNDTRAEWTLNASGLAAINTSGNTMLGTLLKWDLDDSFTGTWVSNGTTKMRVFFADNALSTDDPMLVIETTTGSATAPDAFVTGEWSVADLGTKGDIRITISTLPDNGGSAITDLEYQLDGGSWVSLSATTTGTYDIAGLTDGTEYSVKIRAVNAEGNGADSDAKTVTPTGVPEAFTSGMWSVNNLGTGGDIRISITTLPAANGASITDLEYKIDAGAWTSLAGATTGNYDIAGLTDDVEVDVMVRAVNATGNGADSDTKAVTPTTASGTPTVTTQAVSDIAQTTATGNGNVITEGGSAVTERGVCWSTSENPTTVSDKATAAGTTGAYTADITGLDPNTTYYVRAYAINTNGTSYGSQVSFTTLAVPQYQLKRYNATTGVWEFIG
jgi:hypothetical protein